MNKIFFKRLTTSTSIVLFISLIFFLSQLDIREDFSFNTQKAYELNGTWTVQYDDAEIKDVILPYQLDLNANTKYRISTILPQLDHNKNTLLLRSSMQDMFVYLDGNLIHEHIKPEVEGIHNPPASLWVTITLPDNYAGKELVIEMNTPIQSFSGIINSVKLDSMDVLLFDLVRGQIFGLIIIGVLFSSGIVLVLVSLFTKINEDARILYLGMMAISTSLWMFAESRLLQFITGNRFILGSLAYLMVPLMAIYFALYIREAVLTQTRFKTIFTYIVFVLQGLMALSILLQITGIQTFIQTMTYELIVISIGALMCSYYMFIEIRNYHNETARRLVKFTLVLLISLILEIGSFFLGTFSSISSFMRLGSFIFFLLLIADTIIYIRESVGRKNETLILERLAYKDFLTGGLNRTSYEKDLEKKISEKQSFRLNLLDLNYLKYINDNYGHNVGDDAIKLIYGALESAFKEIGTSYRIGGDEFAVIINDVNPDINNQAITKFNLYVDEINKKFIYPLKVAIGTDVYTYEQWEQFSRFYHHVDQKMYENKSKIKSAE